MSGKRRSFVCAWASGASRNRERNEGRADSSLILFLPRLTKRAIPKRARFLAQPRSGAQGNRLSENCVFIIPIWLFVVGAYAASPARRPQFSFQHHGRSFHNNASKTADPRKNSIFLSIVKTVTSEALGHQQQRIIETS